MRTSWKTSVCGSLTAAGAALMGAAQFDWMTEQEKHNAMLLGFILTVIGPLLHGIVGRDDDKSDQQVGLRPEIYPPQLLKEHPNEEQPKILDHPQPPPFA
jgi:hypothetical protein